MTNDKLKMTNEGIKFIIKIALREDVGEGDITTKALVDKGAKARGEIVAKEAGVVAGLLVAKEVFAQVDRRIKFAPKVKDGAKVKKGKVIATVSGPARGILTGERVALNFLQRMSGIATLTREFVKRAQGAKPQILDTRKTTPGLRALEKYAVKMGGGANHRMGLYDAILIKDNHIEMSGGVGESIQRANYKLQITKDSAPRAERKRPFRGEAYGGQKPLLIEVETKTLAQVKQAITAGADKILLDNMSLKTMRQAVRLCKKVRRRRIGTEASGGVNLKTVAKIAKTGVDAISVGALTHSAKALDISLEIGSIRK